MTDEQIEKVDSGAAQDVPKPIPVAKMTMIALPPMVVQDVLTYLGTLPWNEANKHIVGIQKNAKQVLI